MKKNAKPADLPSTPTEWPGAFGIYNYSRAALLVNFWSTLLPLGVIYILIDGATRGTSDSNDGRLGVFSFVALLVEAVVLIPLLTAALASVRRKKISFSQSLEALNFKRYLNFLGTQILTFLAIIISLLALVIPFFFIMPRLVLASFFVVDQDMGPVEAIKASWNTTKGAVGAVYGILGASIFYFIAPIIVAFALLLLLGAAHLVWLGALFMVAGIIMGIYLLVCYSLASPILYEFLQKQR